MNCVKDLLPWLGKVGMGIGPFYIISTHLLSSLKKGGRLSMMILSWTTLELVSASYQLGVILVFGQDSERGK